MLRRRLTILALAMLSACSTVPPEGAPSPQPEPPAATPPGNAQRGTTPARPTLGSGRTLRAMPVRPLNVATQCSFQNETGYRGTANVEVRAGQVRRLQAVFNIPEHGQCVIDMARMHQTRSLPSVEMRDSDSGCTARMWEQGRVATVSFSGCASYCSPGEAFKYVWPILIQKASGHCD